MSPNSAIAVIGIDIGKNSFHVVGQDKRGAIMLRQKWSRGQAEARLANLPPCLGFRLIKSTIQEQRRGRQRPDNFVPACRSGSRYA